MLSVLKEKAVSLVSFLGNFVRDEGSQVTKVGVLQVASILGILSIMMLPQTVAASGPCDSCYYPGMPCDPSTCTKVNDCQQGCSHWRMNCSGGGYYHVVDCPNEDFCNATC